MPIYNAQDYLTQSIKSIQSQTIKNWELIAVNDGSTDNSLQILKKIAKTDSRIKIFSFPNNLGIAHALNFALTKSSSHFIARMDADDVAFKNRLQLQYRYLTTHPQTVLVGAQCQLINHKGETIGLKKFPIQHNQIYQLALLRTPLQHPVVMINRSLLPTNFKWYDQNHVPAEDLDLFFRLFQIGQVTNLPHTLLKYRQVNNSLSLSHPKKTFLTALKIRLKAMSDYQYRPQLQTLIIFALQNLFLLVLPSRLIYKLYFFVINKNGQSKTKNIITKLPSPKNILPNFNFSFYAKN